MQAWLNHIRHHYIDTFDPERIVIKLALRTTLACTLSILLFQYFGNLLLSSWAGFATFAFVQNDTREFFSERLYFLSAVIIVFTFVTFLGMYLGSHNKTLFIFTTPFIIFMLAYPACLGFSYFTAGCWAMFLYVLAGSNPLYPSTPILWTFLICGLISLLTCFFTLPFKPYHKILTSYERLLIKLSFILYTFQYKKRNYILKFNMQLDQMLISQEKNLANFLKTTRVSTAKQNAFIGLTKSLYQLCLMTKSTIAFRQYAPEFIDYPDYHKDLSKLMAELINAVIQQIKHKTLPDFKAAKIQLNIYREGLTQLRKGELTKPEPDFNALLNYSSYFYHFIKLLEILEMSSQDIERLI